MALILDISTRKLVVGENITIKTYSDELATALTGEFEIVPISATSIATTLQVNETSEFVPSDQILAISVERLANVIGQISKVVNVSTNNSVITITFDNDTLYADCTTTLNTVPVRRIKSNGSVILYSNPFVANITVTSITHKLVNFLTPTLGNPHGNMGDLLQTEIFFTSADSFAFLEFFYGWVDNTTTIYPNPSSFEIDLSNFEDITTGALQKYIGDTSSINAVTPIQGNKVESIILTNISGNNYKLTIQHVIPILPRPIDSQNGTLVQPAEITTSLKMPFLINLRQSLFDTNKFETTSKQNLTSYIQLGSIGYFNEVQKSGLKLYNSGTFTWNNAENELNSGFDTTFSFTVNKISGNFDTVHDVVVNICELTDSYSETETLLQNIKLDNVLVKMDGISASSTNITNVSCTFVGNVATIIGTIPAAKYNNNYCIWVEIGAGTSAFTQQNLLAKIGTAINIADDTTVVFGTFPSAPRAEYNYTMHYTNDIAESFNQVKSYVEDFVLSRFRITNLDLVNNTLVSFTIRIRSNNIILDSFQINADEIPFTFDRNYNLNVGDIRNNVSVVTDGLGNYDFEYPFQIIPSWANSTNIVQETIAVFEQQTAIGLIEFSNTWISPIFQIGNYNQTKNTFGEPQITAPPSKIQFFDNITNDEYGNILNTGVTKIVATFTESNLNDFQADPTAPFTYLDNDFVNNYLCAYFAIEGNGQYFRFHSLQDNGNTPFLGTFPILERISINEAKLTATISASKIREYFGTNFECLKITARIDKLQYIAITPNAYLNSAYSNGYS